MRTTAALRIGSTMVDAVTREGSGWEVVPGTIGATVRFTETVPTPDYHRGDGFGRWPEETYDRHVFVTLVGGKVILGVAMAPWVGRNDSHIPFWLAEEILADPSLGLDTERQLQRKAERKAARGDSHRTGTGR